MSKNIQCCAKCGEKLTSDYRMELMMGPKGFRSYPVHVGKCPPKKAVRSAKPGNCSLGYDMTEQNHETR
jgi:hypothetical protein